MYFLYRCTFKASWNTAAAIISYEIMCFNYSWYHIFVGLKDINIINDWSYLIQKHFILFWIILNLFIRGWNLKKFGNKYFFNYVTDKLCKISRKSDQLILIFALLTLLVVKLWNIRILVCLYIIRQNYWLNFIHYSAILV